MDEQKVAKWAEQPSFGLLTESGMGMGWGTYVKDPHIISAVMADRSLITDRRLKYKSAASESTAFPLTSHPFALHATGNPACLTLATDRESTTWDGRKEGGREGGREGRSPRTDVDIIPALLLHN